MSLDILFLIFGPSIIFITVGIVLFFIPIKFSDSDYRGPNDPSRFLSHHGISSYFLTMTKKEQEYFKKVGPKTFIVFGILCGCSSALINFMFPLWDKNLICTVNSVAFMMFLFLYIERKIDKI